jgi:hypothetical protein
MMAFERDRVRALDVDHQRPVEDEEELVLDLVLVPVEVALDHAQPDDRVVDLGERLVEPGLDGGGLGVHVDVGERVELDVEVDVVGHATEATAH